MLSLVAATARALPRTLFVARDLVALTKPRITAMVVLTAAIGYALAPPTAGTTTLLAALVGLALTVGGANALNQYLERDSDALMARTRGRPIPAGRMPPAVAVGFGLGCAAMGIPALTLLVNPLSGLLASIALLSYVVVYTPLKRRTPAALYVGAIPGALPPLLGWTAATGRIEAAALALFAIQFVWQVPHFLALALVHRDEFADAGLPVWPVARGERETRRHILAATVALVPVTLLPAALGPGGAFTLAAGAALGAVAVALAVRCARSADASAPRALFRYSLVHLTTLLLALVLDALP